ncbi:plasmid-partitioning protein, partial [Salmonella enterica]|nr:plasmid-partitioning protein [Salmonella enterica]
GASALYKGDKVILSLDKTRLPPECIVKIENILRELQQSHTS